METTCYSLNLLEPVIELGDGRTMYASFNRVGRVVEGVAVKLKAAEQGARVEMLAREVHHRR